MPGPRGPRDDHAAIRRLADELVPALMARLEASPLAELEVRQDGWRVRLRKAAEAATGTNGSVREGRSRPAAGKVTAARSGSVPGSPKGAAPAPEHVDPPKGAILSPAVGIFHPRSGASLGTAVRAGDLIGHVEVLGVPQEVAAPFDGVLGRSLVKGGDVVEYGEPLMRIEAAGHPAGGEPAVLEIGTRG